MTTSPTCPQCGGSGVRNQKITDESGRERFLWFCELDHKFVGPS